jgi:murein L,D-transpeptidase YcbB/YkuD
MEQVIFHPYWGVPDSIKKNELLPSLARGNTGVLERNNLRVSYRGRDIDPGSVDWSKADLRKFHVYQPPGGSNVLGVVKFRFPNKHDVYMHDTPSKSLFNASVRAFSHGCMRVRDPVKLAQLVLAEDRGWPAGRVAAAVSRGPKDNQINLATKVPVHMTYFTAWVDDDGKLRTFADIYGHENRIALGLAGKSNLIEHQREEPVARTKQKKPPAQTASNGGRNRDRDWTRRVFEY